MKRSTPARPTTPSMAKSRRHRRRLLDSYGESLVQGEPALSTPLIRHEAYQACRAAHMPHLIDKRKMAALQKRFPEPWRATATAALRSGEDAQYAFSYMHFVMETHDSYDVDLREVWRDLDSDRDGELRGNEV